MPIALPVVCKRQPQQIAHAARRRDADGESLVPAALAELRRIAQPREDFVDHRHGGEKAPAVDRSSALGKCDQRAERVARMPTGLAVVEIEIADHRGVDEGRPTPAAADRRRTAHSPRSCPASRRPPAAGRSAADSQSCAPRRSQAYRSAAAWRRARVASSRLFESQRGSVSAMFFVILIHSARPRHAMPRVLTMAVWSQARPILRRLLPRLPARRPGER